MLVYHSGSYGRANLMVRPGMDEPANDRWFKLETDERGELRRIARQLVVTFQDGAAEVDDELGRYLLGNQLVSAEPQPFTAPPDLEASPGAKGLSQEWDRLYAQEARKPPIAVGQTMTPAVAASQARLLGERLRG